MKTERETAQLAYALGDDHARRLCVYSITMAYANDSLDVEAELDAEARNLINAQKYPHKQFYGVTLIADAHVYRALFVGSLEKVTIYDRLAEAMSVHMRIRSDKPIQGFWLPR